ncbi:hypothetical protein LCGC14_1028250 [marine sediment metagenome]|uniref:Uncharacterized protein n=1 Tax=marine sediment metagenome TaxID=412755 RepID=A0A0F9R1D8_9ZZZZ
MKRLLLIVAILFCVTGCTEYYRCPRCEAAYKRPAFRHGLPGQMVLECRACPGKIKLLKCSEEESGWSEERYQTRGDEIP